MEKRNSSTEQEFFDKFKLQWQESPTNFEFLPILLANNRFLQNEKFIFFNNFNQEIEFAHQNKEVVIHFIKESKLLTNIFLNSNFNQNIKDYLLGVLVGLDSNSRKNKSGRFLPALIKTLFKKHNFNFQEEILLTDILKGVELKETKRMDFVFQHNNTTYLLECSFFNNSGSKINSELKRLVEFDNIINKFKNFRFIYVIDGPGLKKNAVLVDKILTEIKYFIQYPSVPRIFKNYKTKLI
ncbi:MAG: DpnII family type II restriction endonuclease [Candidatus Phytoplasma sp. TWB_XP]